MTKELDAYTRLLGLTNVWIHNDGSKVYAGITK